MNPPPKYEMKKVTFRNRGKAHRGLYYIYSDGRNFLTAACSCPGSQNGSLTNGATIVRDGWENANCKR